MRDNFSNNVGGPTQDEDFPPEDPDDIDPNHFEFFGYGQPGNGPAPPPDGPNAQNQFAEDQGNQVWPLGLTIM